MAQAFAARKASAARRGGRDKEDEGSDGGINMVMNPAMLARAQAGGGAGADVLSAELLESIVDAPSPVQVRLFFWCVRYVCKTNPLYAFCFTAWCHSFRYDLQWATIKSSIGHLYSSVKSLGDENAALKRSAAQADLGASMLSSGSKQRMQFSQTLVPGSGVEKSESSPRMTGAESPERRQPVRAASSRRAFDVQQANVSALSLTT
jgi:hypothetical protein